MRETSSGGVVMRALLEYLAEKVDDLGVLIAILVFGTLPIWLGLLADVVHR